jgi:hypothetical protein
MKLATKGLPVHLLAHLKSMHGFTRLFIEARDIGMANTVSAEASEDATHCISVFDMERGLIDYRTLGRISPFDHVSDTMRRKELPVGPGQVGVYSSTTYAGLAYIELRLSKETLALYFDLSGMQTAQQLPPQEKVVLLIIANERDARRAAAFKALYVTSRINSTAVLEDLQAKKLVRLTGGHGTQYRSITLTPAAREVLSHISGIEHRQLFDQYLGRNY